jgi:CheY-like chemotaxis protein
VLNRAPILIVEDEPLIALELQLSVEDAGGLIVGPVGSVSAALALVETCEVAAAILDVHLTDRDVAPVAEALDRLNIPMVFHTAEKLPQHLQLRYPASIVYRKPVVATLLIKGIVEIVRQ